MANNGGDLSKVANVEKTVEAIKEAVELLARDAGKRFDQIHGRTEDWLNEDFRRRKVEQTVREVMVNYLIGDRFVVTIREEEDLE